jgi:hypothetical protein
MKMIKLADHNDTLAIVDLLRKFLTETSYSQAQQASQDTEHLCKLTWIIQQHGYIWLAFKDEKPVGLLMAVREPNMWLPRAQELREVVWYVVPEHRSSTVGGKLFLQYCKKGDELLAAGEIQGYFTTQMTTTKSIDLKSRGFKQTETTFLKE